VSMQEATAVADSPGVLPTETPPPDAEAPEVKVEAVAGTDTTDESTEDGEDAQLRDDKGRFKSGVQGRMDELTRARREAEREAAYWRTVAEGKGSGNTEAAPKPEATAFATYDEFVEALSDWKAGQKVAAALAQRAEGAATTARAETFEERVHQARSRMQDFDTVVGQSPVEVAEHIRESILDSDRGPELAYHLAKHPQEAKRLSAMPPLQAARELGRLEASFDKPAADVDAPPPVARPVTNAPPPTRPAASGRTAPTTDPRRMSVEEIKAQLKAGGSRWMR
jgi:hypothetical protein